MKIKEFIYDDIVKHDLIYNDYTIKVFRNKKNAFYSHVVYENDTTSELIYESQLYIECDSAYKDSLNHINNLLNKI